MVRDGVTDITKLEFLGCIEAVRKQAFKSSTIISAFRKTGIWPFNPQPIIEKLHERAPCTPSPEPDLHGSSDFKTPTTLRQINKVTNKLDIALRNNNSLDPEFSYNIGRFIRGSLIAATELIQMKRDLGRTRKAELISKQRRAVKNRPLQTGGVLSVANARMMVEKKVVDEVQRARAVVEAAEKKAYNYAKKVFFEAAKLARLRRRLGLLESLVITDEKGTRAVRRG